MKRSTSQPEVMVPGSEIARRAGVANATARRRLDAAGLGPDGFLAAGRREVSPLYRAGRVDELVRVVANVPEVAL